LADDGRPMVNYWASIMQKWAGQTIRWAIIQLDSLDGPSPSQVCDGIPLVYLSPGGLLIYMIMLTLGKPKRDEGLSWPADISCKIQTTNEKTDNWLLQRQQRGSPVLWTLN